MHRLVVPWIVLTGLSAISTATPAHAEIISIDGTVKSVDAEKRTITVETGTKEMTLDVGSKAKISIDGKDSGVDGLTEGQTVTLSYHDQLEVVVKIEVNTSGIKNNKDGFVPLFNGRDLTGWQGKVDDPPKIAKMSSAQLRVSQRNANESAKQHWQVMDGVLHYDGKGTSLTTVKNFRNFELYMDWKIEAGGDSGIYLRGCPQVQIWDSAKPVAKGVGSGGLFNNQRHPSQPSVNADLPVGEWNSFRIRMIGQTVSVWLNDELVVDEVTMENYWDRGQPVFPDGPLELQHHDGHLQFRNILIKELE